MATSHLIELGARRIATIGHEPDLRGTGTLRRQGYLSALRAAGMTPDEDLIAETHGHHREEGARAMRDLLALPHPPDAVFAFNDLLGLGALREAIDQGARVPEDLRIMGFDDIEECRFSCPRLSSVSPDLNALAETALDRIASSLRDGLPDPEALEHQVSHRVVVRESTAGRPDS